MFKKLEEFGQHYVGNELLNSIPRKENDDLIYFSEIGEKVSLLLWGCIMADWWTGHDVEKYCGSSDDQ